MNYLFILPWAEPEEIKLWLATMVRNWWLENHFILMIPDDSGTSEQVTLLDLELEPVILVKYNHLLGSTASREREIQLLEFIWKKSAESAISIVLIENPLTACNLVRRILLGKKSNIQKPILFPWARPGDAYLVDFKLADCQLVG